MEVVALSGMKIMTITFIKEISIRQLSPSLYQEDKDDSQSWKDTQWAQTPEHERLEQRMPYYWAMQGDEWLMLLKILNSHKVFSKALL